METFLSLQPELFASGWSSFRRFCNCTGSSRAVQVALDVEEVGVDEVVELDEWSGEPLLGVHIVTGE